MALRCSNADDILEKDARQCKNETVEGERQPASHSERIMVDAVFPLSHLSELTCPPHNGAQSNCYF